MKIVCVGGGPAGLQVDVVAEVAEVARLAVDHRHLARDVDQVAGADGWHVGGDRHGRRNVLLVALGWLYERRANGLDSAFRELLDDDEP